MGGGKPPTSSARKRSIMEDMLPPGVNLEDLDKLDKIMLVVSAVGIIVNLVQVVAITNHSWVKATALKDGQPFTALYVHSYARLPCHATQCTRARCVPVRGLCCRYPPRVCCVLHCLSRQPRTQLGFVRRGRGSVAR